jgi:hypothetical protein
MKALGWSAVVILVVIGAIVAANDNIPLPSAHSKTTTSHSSQHSVLGSPSIDATQVDKILCRYSSPACGLGQVIYDEGQRAGIDDVWLMGQFLQESRFGTQGLARVSKSVGNYNCLDQAHYGDLNTWCVGRAAYFSSWAGSIKAYYRVLKLFYFPQGLTTIEKIIPVWAPKSDGNDPDHYIQVVLAAANLWHSGSTDLPEV